MNITLIGASGFVGTRLLGLLNEEAQTYAVRNIDKQQSHFFPQVTEIGEGAFANCEKMTGIDLKNTVKIGDRAFNSCYNLQEINPVMMDLRSGGKITERQARPIITRSEHIRPSTEREFTANTPLSSPQSLFPRRLLLRQRTRAHIP